MPRLPKDIPLPVLVLFAVDVLLLFVYLVHYFLGRPFGRIITRLIDLDAERNISTWFSSLQLFLIGLLFVILAYLLQQRGVREGVKWYWLLALVFVSLSLDEFAGVHEQLGLISDALLPGGDREGTVFQRTGIWMFLLGIPFIIFMLLVARKLHEHVAGRGFTRLFLTGFAVFIGSAVGIEILANFTVGRPMIWSILQISAEEFGEMVGATIMFWATWRLLEHYGITIAAPATIPGTTVETRAG